MTLQVKNVLTVILTAIVGLVSAWVSRVVTRNGSVLIPAICLTAAVLCQITASVPEKEAEKVVFFLCPDLRYCGPEAASKQIGTEIRKAPVLPIRLAPGLLSSCVH